MMRKKILIMMIVCLSVTVVSTLAVLARRQEKATIRLFSEQQSILVRFAMDNVELGLSSYRMDAVKETLGRLQSYSIFAGSILFNAELTPILEMPAGFKLPPSLQEKVLKTGKVTHGEISYEAGVLTDQNGEVIGNLLIARPNVA